MRFQGLAVLKNTTQAVLKNTTQIVSIFQHKIESKYWNLLVHQCSVETSGLFWIFSITRTLGSWWWSCQPTPVELCRYLPDSTSLMGQPAASVCLWLSWTKIGTSSTPREGSVWSHYTECTSPGWEHTHETFASKWSRSHLWNGPCHWLGSRRQTDSHSCGATCQPSPKQLDFQSDCSPLGPIAVWKADFLTPGAAFGLEGMDFDSVQTFVASIWECLGW